MLRSVVLAIFISAAPASISPDDAAEDVDAVTLLQAEVRTKQKVISSTSLPVREGSGTRPEELCGESEEGSSEEAPDLEWLPQQPIFAESAAKSELVAESETLERVVLVCRGALLVATVMVLLDGLRRWQAKSKDGEIEEPELWSTGCRASDHQGKEPQSLAEAARKGYLAALRRYASTTDVNELANGETALHAAARAGRLEACVLLLEHGADVNALDDKGRSAIFVAGAAAEETVCSLLLDRGAKVANIAPTEMPIVLKDLLFWRGLSEER